jgi:hypothetical protein
MERGETIFFPGLKVPRHCSLVLLIGVRLKFGINSTFLILKLLKLEGLHWSEI